MENTKRTIILLLCVIFAFSPLMTSGSFCYADDNPSAGGGTSSSWVPVEDTEALVASFKAYCKSRNLDISHVPNTVKAIVKWDYNQLELYAGLADIDLVSLQAHIWYAYDNNDKVKFFIDKTGVVAFANLYGAIIQQEGLSPNTDKTLYSGKWFQDDNGDGAYCFIIDNSRREGLTEQQYNTYQHGSLYQSMTGGKAYAQMSSGQTFPYVITTKGNTYTYYLCCGKDYKPRPQYSYTESFVSYNTTNSFLVPDNTDRCIYFNDAYYQIQDGYISIIYSTNEQKYYCGTYSKYITKSNNTIKYSIRGITLLSDPDVTNSNISASQGEQTTPPNDKNLIINTNDTTINNYITNENNNITYNYTDDDPTTPPVYTDPYDSNPTGGVLNPDGSINFQMPDLSIDWHLNLNTNNLPFPFSIPYDMINFFNAFSAEPVAPHIQENITIANMTIPIDIDLSWLDDVAGYFRTFVLLIYVFGLIIATRALFHIY